MHWLSGYWLLIIISNSLEVVDALRWGVLPVSVHSFSPYNEDRMYGARFSSIKSDQICHHSFIQWLLYFKMRQSK